MIQLTEYQLFRITEKKKSILSKHPPNGYAALSHHIITNGRWSSSFQSLDVKREKNGFARASKNLATYRSENNFVGLPK